MDRVKKKIHFLDEIDSLVDRLKETVGAKHNKELAQLLGISDKDFSNRKGKGTLLKLLVDWAISEKMDINNLVYGEQSKERQENARPPEEECCKTDAAETRQTVGIAAIHSEGIEGCCSFMREVVIRTATSPKNVFLMTATGNSMEPTIYNGETAMIDTGRTSAHEGGLFVIRMDNNAMIKRVSLRPGDKIKVISDNKEYESYEVSRTDIQIMAQVVWIFRSLIN